MLQKITIEKVLFLDIETVPQAKSWGEISKDTQNLWDKKTLYQRSDETAEDFYGKRAGIMAEFGKIICISVGMIVRNNQLKVKSFAGHDEKKILLEFCELLSKSKLQNVILCGHNAKEFDFPYLSRRMLINGIFPPDCLQLFGKKPWEIPHLDTMELWKFGDWKSYISLELMAHIFNIPSPKSDIEGSQVAHVYYEENNLDRIVSYCEKDVLTLANIFRRMRQEELLKLEE